MSGPRKPEKKTAEEKKYLQLKLRAMIDVIYDLALDASILSKDLVEEVEEVEEK